MAKKKIYAKAADLGLGTHLLGMNTSLKTLQGSTIEMTPMGLLVTSPVSKRKVFVPYANVKAIEIPYASEPDFSFPDEVVVTVSEPIKEVKKLK